MKFNKVFLILSLAIIFMISMGVVSANESSDLTEPTIYQSDSSDFYLDDDSDYDWDDDSDYDWDDDSDYDWDDDSVIMIGMMMKIMVMMIPILNTITTLLIPTSLVV